MLILIMFLIFSSLVGSSFKQTVKTTYLKWTTSISTAQHKSDSLTYSAAEKYWMNNLYERTNERYDIRYYPDNQLEITTDDMSSVSRNGTFDFSFCSTVMLSGYTKAFTELSILLMYCCHG